MGLKYITRIILLVSLTFSHVVKAEMLEEEEENSSGGSSAQGSGGGGSSGGYGGGGDGEVVIIEPITVVGKPEPAEVPMEYDSMGFAVAGVVVSNFGVVGERVIEARNLSTAARLEVLRDLANSMTAGPTKDFVMKEIYTIFERTSGSYAMSAMRTFMAGAAAIQVLAVLAAGSAGYLAGSWIYNNITWFQNGGLDPIFEAIFGKP